LITLRCRGFWRKQRVKCMMWIVHSFIKQLIVTLLQQFVKFRQVGGLKAVQDIQDYASVIFGTQRILEH